MSLLFRIIPELELLPTATERTNHSHIALREVLRPSTFWSPGAAAMFVGVYVALLFMPSFGSLDWARPILILVALMGLPLVVARVGVARFRLALRQQLVMAGTPCCLNCGYSMAGLEEADRCPECNADCSNLIAHAGAPIPESTMFPQLLAFSRPGEAREALARAYADAGVFYKYRFTMLIVIGLSTAVLFTSLALIMNPTRGEAPVPDAILTCLGVATFVVLGLLWHRWVRDAIREALDRQVVNRAKDAS